MRIKTLSLWALIVALLFGNPFAFAKKTLDAIYLPVGWLTISAPRGVEHKRSPVPFPHSLHFDSGCKACHHTWDGHTPVKSCKASGCHDLIEPQKEEKAKKTSDADNIRYYKAAYHQSCRACHMDLAHERKKMEKSGAVLNEPLPKTGPTGCIGCHPKH